MSTPTRRRPADRPHWYQICVTGHLDPRWGARFDGMTLHNRANGTTLIEGRVVDQAALHGHLVTLRDLGVPLLSVTQVDPSTTQVTEP